MAVIRVDYLNDCNGCSARRLKD